MRTKRLIAATALGAVASLVGAGLAVADQVSNNIDASVDAVAEVMPLTVGGADGTTTLYYISTNGDGKNGCNLTGSGSHLTLSISSSDTTKATVSPSSLTFDSCGDTTGNALTVHAVGAGSATISASVSQVVGNDNGTYDVTPVTFTVNVSPASANTAPSILIGGVSGGAFYDKGSVPAAICNVTDAEDGSSSFAATLSPISGPYSSDGIGQQTASCSYTDQGPGPLTASSSVTYTIVDPSGPVISYVLSPSAPGSSGWYTGDVTLTWTVTESESPNSLVKTGCADQSITADQGPTTYSCAASSAGGTATQVDVTIKRDATKPGISCTVPDQTAWYGADVSVPCTAGDVTSGLADSADANFSLSTSVLADTETSSASTDSHTVSDVAGNSDTAGPYTFKVDKKAPTVTAGAPSCALAGLNGWCRGAVTVTFSSADLGSGLANASDATIVKSTSGDGAALMLSSGAVLDAVGNSGSASAGPFAVDATAPDVPTFVGGPADGGYYFPTTVPAAPTCTSHDDTSGLVVPGGCVVTGYSTAVGSHTLLATATDNAGNTSTATVTYNVYTLTLSGFFQPVDMNGVLNTVKNGSTVPLKFRVFDRGTERTDTGVVASYSATPYACTSGVEDVVEELAPTGATVLRYDTTGAQFIYNWQTPKKPGTCYKAKMTFIDGSSLSANFKLK